MMDEVDAALGGEPNLDYDVYVQRPIAVYYCDSTGTDTVEYVRGDVFAEAVAALRKEPSLIERNLRNWLNELEESRGTLRGESAG